MYTHVTCELCIVLILFPGLGKIILNFFELLKVKLGNTSPMY